MTDSNTSANTRQHTDSLAIDELEIQLLAPLAAHLPLDYSPDFPYELRLFLEERIKEAARELEKRPQRQKRTLPLIPDVFATGRALVSSALCLQAVIHAQQNMIEGGDRWQHPEGHAPYYTHETDAGRTIVEYLMSRSNEIQDDKATRSLKRQLVGDTQEQDTDALFIVIAHCIKALGTDGTTWIFANNSLKYMDKQIMKKYTRGSKPAPAGYRTDDKIAFAESIGRLSNFWLVIDQFIHDTSGKKKQGKKTQYTRECRLFSIEEVWYQKELDPNTDTPNLPVGWRVRPGEWLKVFIDQRHVAYLCDIALKYHPLREKWEKRLSSYIMLHMRMNGGGRSGGKYTRKIEDLLRELSLPVNKRDPERTKKRFEQAMNRLAQDRHIAGWDYKEKIKDEPKKWLGTWLTNSIVIYIAPPSD